MYLHNILGVVENSEESLDKIESIPDKVIDCPMCGESVPSDAIECPNCEEPFSPEAFEIIKAEGKGSKWLFWSGLILVIVGGPGIALGSWLHDFLSIPIMDYDNFDSFGWANKLVSSVGIIILVIGIILLILSLPKLRSEDEELLSDETLKEEEEEIIEQTNVTGDQGG